MGHDVDSTDVQVELRAASNISLGLATVGPLPAETIRRIEGGTTDLVFGDFGDAEMAGSPARIELWLSSELGGGVFRVQAVIVEPYHTWALDTDGQLGVTGCEQILSVDSNPGATDTANCIGGWVNACACTRVCMCPNDLNKPNPNPNPNSNPNPNPNPRRRVSGRLDVRKAGWPVPAVRCGEVQPSRRFGRLFRVRGFDVV